MSQGAELQFDRAEFENGPAEAKCAECHRLLTGYYYEVNGQTVCEACRYTIESRGTAGSPAGRFFRASGAGLAAAVLGALLYYAIGALTGYEFGLIAIVVGYGVGSAVRWGSYGRGGWRYQTLAIALTYLAIVATYIPPIVQGLSEMPDETEIAESTAPDANAAAVAETAAVTTEPASNASATPNPPVEVPSAALMGGAVLFILAIAIVAPFLGGVQNIMGLVIIGIGLYEAWKLNRRSELAISGPHALAQAPVASAGV